MKNPGKYILTGALACALLAQGALAETISFTGTVSAKTTSEVYAPIGGTVESVSAVAGQQVRAGDVLATLATTKVYASEDGVITGLFAQAGDSTETVSQRYGAVMYIEGASVYTISASTENAYNSTENKFVHVGEEVYLSCYSDGSHSGTGVITAIEGTSYTVEVTSGEFLIGETVNVYRGETATTTARIGRGTLGRKNPTAVSASGSIVSIAVQDGETVQKGDLLFETLEGSFDGYYMSGSEILATSDGVVAQIGLSQGGRLEKGSVAAVLYPEGAMQIQAQIAEANLGLIHVGDPVEIELNWNSDAEVRYTGVVSMISAIADSSASGGSGESMSSSGDVTYTVYIDFTPDADTRYGMTAVVSTLDAEIEDVEVVEEEAPAEEEISPEEEFARDGRFAADGEGMPDELSDFGGRPMGEGAPEGSGHVKE
ncbi:MAG: HlyD family efflux transporter periplasmic adaptor subunit [Clostridia bacterium]|nr:HlyD family efflux transporter periplasmic adaptor subunit [Clostridia bacterium]